MRICDAIDSAVWLVDEDWLHRIRDIALGEGEGPEAVAARLGRPLQNTQDVRVRDGVAIVPIIGPIFRYANLFTQVSGATSIEVFARDLQVAVDDPAVHAILLEINSPGGHADGINEAAGLIAAAGAKKPLVAYVSFLACSGAYWLAAAADEIVIDATAQLGSIGVVSAVSRRVANDPKTAELVSTQSPHKRPDVDTPEGRAVVMERIDAIAEVFVRAVADFRGVSRDDVIGRFGGGGVKVGQAAIAAGMADAAGSLETTLEKLASGFKPRRRTMAGTNVSLTEQDLTAKLEAARAEGRTAGLEEGKKLGADDARKAGHDDGVKAERERLLAIDRLTMPGQSELAAKAKAEGTSAADFAIRQVESEKNTREQRLAAIQKDGTTAIVPAAPSTTGDPAPAASDPSLPVEERCKALWAKDEKVREEFGTIERFVAYTKADTAGRVRHIRRAV